MPDIYSLLWVWANLRPSESPHVSCSFEWCDGADHVGYTKGKPGSWDRWMDIDMAVSKLSENEMHHVILHVTGRNGRLPLKVARKLYRLFRQRELL